MGVKAINRAGLRRRWCLRDPSRAEKEEGGKKGSTPVKKRKETPHLKSRKAIKLDGVVAAHPNQMPWPKSQAQCYFERRGPR